jgi:hypothetical protein
VLLVPLREWHWKALALAWKARPAVSGKVPGILSELGTAFSTVLRQLIVAGQAAGQVVERDPEQHQLLYLCCLQGLAAGMTFYGENLVAHFPGADAVLQLFKS